MKYKYWLANISGIGNKKIDKLLQIVKTPEELYQSKDSFIRKLSCLSQADKESIIESRKHWNLDGSYENLLQKGIAIYTKDEKEYPPSLKNIADPPYQIYVKGRTPDISKKSVAIVGARECSEYGKAISKEIGYVLSQNDIQVISGLARGIDTYGHVGAIHANKDTYAVLGSGVDVCYPIENRKIYDRICENGGVISEYPPSTKPQSRLFPARNRIISALSDIVILVEAREKSGSLITADFALEQGKDIYAVPGRVNDSLSAGCNRLISQGAGIFLSVEDFIKMNGFCMKNEQSKEIKAKNLLEKQEMVVYSCLDLHPKSMDEIISETGIGLSELSMILIDLQQKEIIRESFKNYYIRSF